MQAADMVARGKRIGLWRLAFEMPVAFFRYYIVRREFLHGFYGFTIAVNAAFSRYLRLAKTIELQRTAPRKDDGA
jgi:hypothetical protein